MSLKAGIVGMPNVGKSTLFNVITKSKIEAANYPFATIEPNVGIVEVPDSRLDELTKIITPQKVIPTTFEFTDIAGLVKGAAQGEGLGNQFLANIREVDAICHVVRCFDDANIIHVEDQVNPIRDAEIINLELGLADLEQVDKRIGRIRKKAELGDKEAKPEYDVLLKVKSHLENDKSVRTLELSQDEKKLIHHLNLLTIKPMMYIANVLDSDLMDLKSNKHYDALKQMATSEGNKVVVISAKIEEDLIEMDAVEKIEFLKELGINESGLDTLIHEAYNLLGLETYFTAGVKEVRAWTFKKGMTAPECAGIIHTDFERGFIRAEIMKYIDIIELKDEKKVKDAGKLQVVGKDYLMQDGDVVHFLFNV